MPRDNSHPVPDLLQTSLKKEKKSFDDVSVFTRLSRIGLEIFPITLEDKIKGFLVGRFFLSRNFGGNPAEVFPAIEKERLQDHGFDNFMYCTLVSMHNP